MKYLAKSISILAVIGAISSCSITKKNADYHVIPLPIEITTIQGDPFNLTESSTIFYPKGSERMHNNALYLAEYLQKATGKEFSVKTGNGKKGSIILTLGLQSENPEAYQLNVNKDGVIIAAPTEAGVFYGIQTLRKSIPIDTKAQILLPAVTINDAPRFSYRGVHFDVSRHFFTVEEVKTYIDMMVLHNMNHLHWHITDDQGWRIEIKKYPKLTEIGSKRKETVIGREPGEYDGVPYGGFYTQEQAKEIVAYAADRYVTVIPEIDLPGHMQAALTAYPQMGCTGGPYEVWTRWGVSDNVLCAGNDEIYTFIDDVFAEIMEIFPSKYIHVGGDECPKTQWERCPKCQARAKQLGIKGDKEHTTEEYLQSHIIHHAEKYLNNCGRQIIGWDEILEGGAAPNSTIMSWRSEAGGIEAAQSGLKAIMVPNAYLYFDYYQTKDIENEPFAIGGYVPIDRVYNYEPMPSVLTPEQQKYIIGMQANLWTEYISTFPHVQYMTLPRWAALAEGQWSDPAQKNYDNFLSRLPALVDIYDVEKYNYATHVFDAAINLTTNTTNGTVEVEVKSTGDSHIYYTLDDTEPTEKSPKYTGKFSINESCVFKAKTIRGKVEGRTSREQIFFSKSTAKPIIANQQMDTKYAFGGISTLVDGLKGDSTYSTGRWIASSQNNLDATIDLQQITEISSASISTCVIKEEWLFDAKGLSIEVSDDGKNFTKVSLEEYPVMNEKDRDGIYEHTLTFAPVKARYVKVVVVPESSIPSWHKGKGKQALLFVDEIMLN